MHFPVSHKLQHFLSALIFLKEKAAGGGACMCAICSSNTGRRFPQRVSTIDSIFPHARPMARQSHLWELTSRRYSLSVCVATSLAHTVRTIRIACQCWFQGKCKHGKAPTWELLIAGHNGAQPRMTALNSSCKVKANPT